MITSKFYDDNFKPGDRVRVTNTAPLPSYLEGHDLTGTVVLNIQTGVSIRLDTGIPRHGKTLRQIEVPPACLERI